MRSVICHCDHIIYHLGLQCGKNITMVSCFKSCARFAFGALWLSVTALGRWEYYIQNTSIFKSELFPEAVAFMEVESLWLAHEYDVLAVVSETSPRTSRERPYYQPLYSTRIQRTFLCALISEIGQLTHSIMNEMSDMLRHGIYWI